jgi:hypothetical protein
VRRILLGELGDRRRLIELNLGRVEHNRFMSADGPNEIGDELNAGRQTIGDFFMLTLADVLVVGTTSTFSESAALLGSQEFVKCHCDQRKG